MKLDESILLTIKIIILRFCANCVWRTNFKLHALYKSKANGKDATAVIKLNPHRWTGHVAW